MTGDARQIRELVDSWIAASEAGDLSTLMEMMTGDVVFITPCRPPFEKTEFASDRESMRGVAIDARSEVQEIEILGLRAYIRSHIQVELTFPDQTSRRMSDTR
jgi:uncharacterized protein (TIGR02246 family)